MIDYSTIGDNQLFSMYNRSGCYKRKTAMRAELKRRGYFSR